MTKRIIDTIIQSGNTFFIDILTQLSEGFTLKLNFHSALFVAITCDKAAVVNVLLDQGANILATAENGVTVKFRMWTLLMI